MTLRSFVKTILPTPVLEFAKRLMRKGRRTAHRISAAAGEGKLDRAKLAADLRSAGLLPGSTVIVHSSFSKIGEVDGGPRTVTEALLEVLGPSGTLVVPTIHLRTSATDHFASNPVFDVLRSSSAMGAISESVRQLPGAVRSMHPTHSVAAIGPQAKFLCEEHHLDERPFGPHSPYHRIGEVGGTIVLLGVPLANMTNFHVVEDLSGDAFPYPVYLPEVVEARVIGPDNVEVIVRTRIHNPVMSKERRCNQMEALFSKEGVMREAVVGKARTLLLDAKILNDVLRRALAQNVTMYTPDGIPLRHLLRS